MGSNGDEERGHNLLVDLANIINNPAFSDVVLISKDGDRLWACRILLAARSPVFQSMLMNGVTVEATSLEIPLPSIRTHALLPILEYIYTGKLSKYGLSLHNSIDVIYASRYLLLSKLEELAISFLSAHSVVSLCDGLGPDVPKHLSQAVELLSPDLDSKILTLLVEAITFSSQCVENVVDFSREAMCFYLDMTFDNAIRLSAAEYARLRCLLMWCAHFISFAAAKALSVYLPVEQPEIIRTGYASDAILLSACKPYQSSLAEFFKPWISKVNFYQVHPQMLAGFIEPLGIIEPSNLLQIYRFHAMFVKELSLLHWAGGAYPSNFRLHEEGSVIECSSDIHSFSFATTGAPLTRIAGVYEWDFVIERACPFMGLGFCSADAFVNAQSLSGWLGYKEYGWIICCTGDLYHNSKTFHDKIAYTSEFGEGARINVRLCMEEGKCEFKIGDRVCGVAWDNVPYEVYPAVTMKYPGRVRIEAARHEEIKILKELETIDAIMT